MKLDSYCDRPTVWMWPAQVLINQILLTLLRRLLCFLKLIFAIFTENNQFNHYIPLVMPSSTLKRTSTLKRS